MRKTVFCLFFLFIQFRAFASVLPGVRLACGMSSASDTLQTAEPQDSAGKKRLKWAFQIMPFARKSAFKTALGSINPDNRVAQLNQQEGGVYFRPELEYAYRKFAIKVKPRYNIDFDGDQGGLGKSTNYSSEFYFQQFKAKWQLSNTLSIQGGRYIKLVGTSMFLNPSNPFFINPGRLNPKLELRPMDFIEVNYATNAKWNLSLMVNVYGAQSEMYQEPFFDFKRTYALLTEYFGESGNMGILLSVDEAKKAHLGSYGQKNVSEAVLLWYDVALDYRINRFYPQAGHSTELLDYEMVNGDENKKGFFSGLLGASYTLSVGPTIQLEYYYNGKGYRKEQLVAYYSMIESASSYNFDITKELAKLNLGRAINTGMPYLRNHYAFLQVGDRDLFDKFNYNLRYLFSVDDGSSQLSSLIEFDLFDRVEIFGLGLKSFGGRKTELPRLIDSQITLGLLIKF